MSREEKEALRPAFHLCCDLFDSRAARLQGCPAIPELEHLAQRVKKTLGTDKGKAIAFMAELMAHYESEPEPQKA